MKVLSVQIWKVPLSNIRYSSFKVMSYGTYVDAGWFSHTSELWLAISYFYRLILGRARLLDGWHLKKAHLPPVFAIFEFSVFSVLCSIFMISHLIMLPITHLIPLILHD